MDEILEQARIIGSEKSWDDAALFLGPYRRQYAGSDLSQTDNLGALIAIVTTQLEALRKAQKSNVAIDVGTWFHHVLHDLPAIQPGAQSREILRECLARFFCEYARNLCVMERYEEMRLSMRSALDTTRALPFVIVSLVHLYAPLAKKTEIEGESSKIWLTKRYCECLALLDFAGLARTAFRATLDDFQAAMRDEKQAPALYEDIKARRDEKDPALETLTKLFEAQFLNH